MRLLCRFGWHRWEVVKKQATRNVGMVKFIQCRRCGETSFIPGVSDE